MLRSTPLLLALVGLAGCDFVKENVLPDVTIEGSIKVTGTEPSEYTFELYSALDNQSAFDTDYCDKDGLEVEGECYGRVKLNQLGEPEDMNDPEVDGTDFVLSGVNADIGYILIVGSADPDVICTTDIVGFDQDTKVVTDQSAIAFDIDNDILEYELPRKVRLDCFDVDAEPVLIEPGPIESPPGGEDIPAPATVNWDSFLITDKGGSPELADATDESVIADVECDENFPPVVEVRGTIADGSTQAYVRIQFGSGADAVYDTIEVPVVDGKVNQPISLTGGYAVVQLDTDTELDGMGESNTITFCEPDDRPAQELLVILSWDRDDTDVDTHVFSQGSEVAYYSLRTDWGELDIDDINGFGPETVTSAPAVEGESYDVRIHYYSDHGNGDTNATARVVYTDPTGGVCDITQTKQLTDGEWWAIGTFEPGTCP